MTIKIEIPKKQLFEKILWFLNRFKSDGVKITTLNNDEPIVPKKSEVLESLEQIIQTKSENGIGLDSSIILDPHSELSRDIS